MKKFLLLTGFSFLVYQNCCAQKSITLQDAIGRTFAPKQIEGFNWMNDSRYFTKLEANKILRCDVKTGLIKDTLAQNIPFEISDYALSPDEQKILLQTNRIPIYRHSFTADYYLYDIKTKIITKISNKRNSYATFSPDGKMLAYVRENNLWLYDILSQKETQITFDGKPNYIINGSTDWVNEEEFGYAQAFWWSPDSKKIAYQTFDETHVKEYNMQIWGSPTQLYPKDYKFKYPKAGETNSVITVTIHSLTDGRKYLVDLGDDTTIYVPRVMWTNSSNILSIRTLNRLQNRLSYIHYDFNNKKANVVLIDSSKTYVDIEFCDELLYSRKNDFFVFTSEKDGYKHIYKCSIDGKNLTQITKGTFDVFKLLAMNENPKETLLYYISNEESLLGRQFYRISLDKKVSVKLSRYDGTNEVNMSKDLKYYQLINSSTINPVSAYLYQTEDNIELKKLIENEALKEMTLSYGFGLKEMFSFKNSDGVALYGYMIKPISFDTTKKYPLLIHTYGGPGRQMVTDSWGGSNFIWHQMLAQKGYIIAVVDNRGVPGYGEAFKKATYKALGDLDSRDQISAASFFASKPYIDASRIGIWGWSYGGYMAAVCAMKAPNLFRVAISVAPVTSWRFYDTIYTERFLQTPQMNPAGYDQHSPIHLAPSLKAKYLLIHGTGDDNVHFQNAVALQNALIAAGVQFQSFYYPDRNHGIYGGNTRLHLYRMMTDFIVVNL